MLHAGLDLSRKRLDVCVLDEHGERVIVTAASPDADGLRHLVGEIGAFRGVGGRDGRVDDWRSVRPRQSRASGLGRRDRRRPRSEGTRATGLQDRSHRRVRSRRAQPARPRAGYLASGPRGARGARASPVPASSRSSAGDAEESRPRKPHVVREAVPGLGSLRYLWSCATASARSS
jgi:hypothetical protein